MLIIFIDILYLFYNITNVQQNKLHIFFFSAQNKSKYIIFEVQYEAYGQDHYIHKPHIR